MTLSERLAPLMLLNPDGDAVRLGDAWKEHTLVLAFIRHFG